MTLEQVAIKYNINTNSLNAKDDALKVSVKSIQFLVKELERKRVDPNLVTQLKKLGSFLHDVSESTVG